MPSTAESELTKECPTCEGTGETPIQDHWSYGDSKGRGEGHYTTGGDKCPCCNGTERVPFESSHDGGDDCGLPDWMHEPEPPEPEGL